MDEQPPPTVPLRIRLAKPDIGDDDVEAVRRAMLSGVLTNGPETEAFEAEFAARHGASHGVAFANGTVALTGILLALGIQPGDEVIMPSLTFISTATSVLHIGGRPVFADVTDTTYNLDPTDIEHRITARTRAIVAVHYAGQPADMDELAELARQTGLALIEDAAEAHGAHYKGKPVGGLARAGMFSFTPTKNITTGEGGMVTTNDPALASHLRLLRNHGQTRAYYHEVLGFNWRLSEMQAALGRSQLRKLDQILARKANNARRLSVLLKDAGILLPQSLADRTHVFMMYSIRTAASRRLGLIEALRARGIESRIYFPPAHQQPLFRQSSAALPTTDRLAGELLSIPFHSLLSDDELVEIAQVVRNSSRVPFC
jgi:perosamine synthetase